MRKKIGSISKKIAILVFASGIVFGIIYLRLIVPSERELWRVTDNNISDPIIVNELLLFEGDKGEFPSSCEYIYAVNKNAGDAAWSSESITDHYCDHSWGSVFTAIILIAERKDVIFLSTSYWATDDKQDYVLYALSSSNGELLWKVDGYAGYPYNRYDLLDYTSTDTNYIYVANQEGSLSAINNSTGQQVWKQKIPSVDYSEDILIEYHDQVVYYYYSGNNTLTAFNATNGSQIWSVSEPHYAGDIMFSGNMIYLNTFSPKSSTSFITALETKTGNPIWELAFESISTPEIIGNEIYIPVSYGYTLGKFVVLNKSTGKVVWQFNEDYSHGDIRHFIKDNVIYIGTKDGFLFALDSKTGKSIWQTKSPGFPYYFHVDRNTLVVIYEERYIAAFDINSGKQKWILDSGIDTLSYPPDFVLAGDGVIYITSTINSTVYAINDSTGKVLWTWKLYGSNDKAYLLKALDNNVLYVDQDSRFFGYNWFFALQTKP